MAKAAKESLLTRIKNASTIVETTTLDKCKFINDKDTTPTPVPALNAILSGTLDGGFGAGFTQFAGKSKMFKTGLMLLGMSSYLRHHKDSVGILYINEFGSPAEYFKTFGIPEDRVLISPIVDVEQLKIDFMAQLDGISRGDRVFVGIDSIGNLASRHEIEVARKEETTVDMTRAKIFKSVGRIITPHLTLKNIPCVAINHVYSEMKTHGATIVSGGTGMYLSSDNIYIVTREKKKDKDDNVIGYEFHVRVEKSRFVKEGSMISIDTSFGDGVSRWSGLLDIGLQTGHIIKGKDGSSNIYTSKVTGQVCSLVETNKAEFWDPLLADEGFKTTVKNLFTLGTGEVMDLMK